MVKLTILSLQQMILIISTKNNSFINSNILPKASLFGEDGRWVGAVLPGFALGRGNAKDAGMLLRIFGVWVGISGLEFLFEITLQRVRKLRTCGCK